MGRQKAIRKLCKKCGVKKVKRASAKFCSMKCALGTDYEIERKEKVPVEIKTPKKMREKTGQMVNELPASLRQDLKELPKYVRHLVAELAMGETRTSAGLLAGIEPGKVKSKVSGELRKPAIRGLIREILIAHGFTDDHYAKGMYEGSMAMKSVALVVHKFDREGKLDDANAETTSFVEVPDWQTRRFYYQMGGKGLGHDVDKGDVAQQEELHIHFDQAEETKEGKEKPKEQSIEAAEFDPVEFVESADGD